MSTVWVIEWYHEDGESGAWVAATFEAAIRSITENEELFDGDEDPDAFILDLEWAADDRGMVHVRSEAAGMAYAARETGVVE